MLQGQNNVKITLLFRRLKTLRNITILFILLAFSVSTVSAACPAGDIDGNCEVNFVDLGLFVGQWLDANEPFYESGGLVVAEAEHFFSKADGSGPVAEGIVWTEMSGEGAVGDSYMQVLPDWGRGIDVQIETYSPRLSYLIDFSTPGEYYLWLKGMAGDSGADSVHFGLDGQAVSSDRWTSASLLVSGVFTWRSKRGDSTRPALTVGSDGLHTLDIWMREDGAKIDRVLMTTDKDYSPSSPSESSGFLRSDADLDGNGAVNLADFALMGNEWLEPGKPVVINEFMAINDSNLADEDGEFRDWIELLNISGVTVNLSGWYLTDNMSVLDKWQFPEGVQLGPGEFLVVFASDKDRRNPANPLHTNFKLGGSGEYLAIVRPDLIISHKYDEFWSEDDQEFGFPPQSEDVSYGLTLDLDVMAFFDEPTPGAANLGMGIGSPPQFSQPGKFFTDSFALELTTDSANAVINYTLDGSEPDEIVSPLYQSPINISATTVVKAAVYNSGVRRSLTATERYVKLDDDVRDFNSNLPIVLVDTFGQDVNAILQTPVLASVIDTTDGRARITDTADFTGAAAIKIRGSAAAGGICPKKMYAFETWGEDDDDLDVSFLDFPAQSDWILYGPYNDKSLLRNVLMYKWSNDIDRYAPRTRFVEMFLNNDDDSVEMGDFNTVGSHPFNYNGDYVGIYVLMEKIKRDENRVNIARLDLWDNNEPNVTGGYIVKIDRIDPDDEGFYTWRGNPPQLSSTITALCNVYPKEAVLTSAQAEWIKGTKNPQDEWIGGYFNEFDDVLQGSGFADPVNGYAKYVDVDSFIDNHNLRAFSLDPDGFRLSQFFYKDRGGKLTAGPLWDLNITLGNAYVAGFESWYLYYYWPFDRLFDDPEFWLRYRDRWYELTEYMLTAERLLADIDKYVALLNEAIDRNYARWPRVLGYSVWPHTPGSADRKTYQEEIDYLKQWVQNRLEWINNIGYGDYMPPIFYINGQREDIGAEVPSGVTLTISKPPGAPGTIYYTLDGSDPRLPGGAINSPSASIYGGPIILTTTTRLKARIKDASHWSAVNKAVFLINMEFADANNLRITEVHYNPRDADIAKGELNVDSDQFEFIELKNVGVVPVLLDNVKFADGICYAFDDDAYLMLAAGSHIAIIKNEAAFASRYNTSGMNIAPAEYTRSLANNGENIELKDYLNETIVKFRYNDARGWPLSADGGGHSLVPLDAALLGDPNDSLSYGGNWRASVYIGGSPGQQDPTPITAIVLNEIMAHTDYENPLHPEYNSNDWIELYNTTGSTFNISDDWYLSDDIDEPNKWAIPSVAIPPFGRISFDEVTEFHNPITSGFGLNKSGEEVVLSYLPGNTSDCIVDCVRFKAQQDDISLGRYPDGGTYWFRTVLSRDSANTNPVLDVVINELMYHPAGTNEEYIELYNPTGQQVNLWNGSGGWRLAGTADYTFPVFTSISSGDRLIVVGFDPAVEAARLDDFEAAYGTGELTAGEDIVGPLAGYLCDGGQRVRLEKPQAPDQPGQSVSWIIVDEVIYFNQAPWPETANGTGNALQRIHADQYHSGNDPDNWAAGVASPGQ